MNVTNSLSLKVTFFPPATSYKPVDERKYTLKKAEETGERLLTIGYCYDGSAMNGTFRDEICAKWVPRMGQYVLNGKVHISSGEFDEKSAENRFMFFQQELKTSLTCIVYGDRDFYDHYPWLLDSPIYIHFDSIYPQYNQILYCGTPRQYLTAAMHQSVS